MKVLITLTGYEYKKIFHNKSTWIVLTFALLLTLISCVGDLTGTVYVEGKPVYSHYEEFQTDRTYARALSGRALDAELIHEMQEAYRKAPNVPLFSATKEYQMYARPYSSIYFLVRDISVKILDQKSTSIDTLAFNGLEFYQFRNKAVQQMLEKANLTTAEEEKHLEMNEQVKTPLIFQYTDGYRSILSRMYTIGIILILTLTICLAPIFANEYLEKTDQIILVSRYGKNKEILAKIVTGISLGFIVSITFLLVEIIPTLLIYGFDGWNAQIQLLNITSTFPITLLESILILCGMVMTASLLITCLCLFLSASLKSAFAVMVVMATFTILCIFIKVPEEYRFLYQLVNTLPANVMSSNVTFSYYFYAVFGKCFPVYQAVPVIYDFLSVCLCILCYLRFKNHQIFS